jgi:hypothetical protein
MHRASQLCRRTLFCVRFVAGLSVLVINTSISMLMMGGFTAAHGGLVPENTGVLACSLYIGTFGLVALSVVLDVSAQRARRRLHHLLLVLEGL